jgi:hypothetical protein
MRAIDHYWISIARFCRGRKRLARRFDNLLAVRDFAPVANLISFDFLVAVVAVVAAVAVTAFDKRERSRCASPRRPAGPVAATVDALLPSLWREKNIDSAQRLSRWGARLM